MTKKKKSTLATRYKNLFKGILFEIVVERLINKAGFETNRNKLNIKQFTKTKRLHGRGSTYNPDIVGIFKLPVPFSYPILLIGETKYYKKKVNLKTVREFLGAFIDTSQYPRIETKSRSLTKYEQLFYKERFNYVPVIFSSKGFAKNAQALMYVHGVYFISYENSPMFDVIRKNIEKLLKKINFSKVKSEDLRLEKGISLKRLYNMREEIKKEGFDEALSNLINSVEDTNSYIGVLDGLWVINFLSKKKLKPSIKIRRSYIKLLNENYIQVRNTENPRSHILGGFSLPTFFLQNYVKYSNKKGKEILQDLVLYLERDNRIYPYYVEFSDESRKEIIKSIHQE